MTSSLTGAEVWAATVADPSFTEEVPEGDPMREVLRPFVEATPVVLADFLDKKATMETVVHAKLAFLKYCLKNGLVQKAADALGAMTGMLEQAFASVVSMLEASCENIPALLIQAGMTEEEAMLDPSMRFNEASKQAYNAGTLTIGDLLRTQPTVIIKNTD